MIIFSFDCAIKNFGYCVIELSDVCWRQLLEELGKKLHYEVQKIQSERNETKIIEQLAGVANVIRKIKDFLDCLVIIRDIGLRDIRDEKSEKLSASKTKNFLSELDEKFGKPHHVLVERQMSLNNHAFAVENFVEYHYANVSPLTIMPPSLKNMICFDEKNGRYECFNGQYTNYIANKKHTMHNCKYFFEKNGIWHKFHFDKIKKFDDLSDAFMMGMAWILLKC